MSWHVTAAQATAPSGESVGVPIRLIAQSASMVSGFAAGADLRGAAGFEAPEPGIVLSLWLQCVSQFYAARRTATGAASSSMGCGQRERQ
jgi:hypothetical protein